VLRGNGNFGEKTLKNPFGKVSGCAIIVESKK
jgi:hypothetical protein